MPTAHSSFFSNATHNRSRTHADRILAVLADGPITVTDLSVALNLKTVVTRRNLRALRHAGRAQTVAVTPDTHRPLWTLTD